MTYNEYKGVSIPRGVDTNTSLKPVGNIFPSSFITCRRYDYEWHSTSCVGIPCSSCICSAANAAIADEYFNREEEKKMKRIFIAGAKMPHLYPGMLVRTTYDRWIQFITTRKSGGVFYGHYLIVDNKDRVAITDSLTNLSTIDSDSIKEVYQCAVKPQCDVPAPLSQTQIKDIILGARNVKGVEVWCNPKYLHSRKMTVAEIEKKLGYKIEIISEEK